MIIYFSATGNSKYAAKRIASRFNDKAVDIVDVMNEPSLEIKDGELFGFVTPTYYWGLPSVCADFLKNTEIRFLGKKYSFLIATYGTKTGELGQMAQNIMTEKGTPFDALFAVKTVDNYIPLFSVKDVKKIEAALKGEEKILDEVIRQIEAGETPARMKDSVAPALAAGVYLTYKRKRATKHFFVSGECVSCHSCENLCPVKAIRIENGKPVWVKDKCALCFGCLHRCPKGAINYIRKNKNGQYVHPDGGTN